MTQEQIKKANNILYHIDQAVEVLKNFKSDTGYKLGFIKHNFDMEDDYETISSDIRKLIITEDVIKRIEDYISQKEKELKEL